MPELTVADRVNLYRLIATAYPEEESAEYVQHRHALHRTVEGMRVTADTGPVQAALAAPRPATSHVNANQPGMPAPAEFDRFFDGGVPL